MTRALHIAGITLFVLLAWQFVVTAFGLPRFILPGPRLVAATLWSSRALIAEHALVTTSEVLLGLGLGAALGFVSAISSRKWDSVAGPAAAASLSEIAPMTVRPKCASKYWNAS